MAKVYITQDNGKNYTPACNFGKPSFVTNKEYSFIENSEANTIINFEISKMTADFNTNEDYLLLSGDPIIIALCINKVLSEYGHVKVLKWQSQDKAYVPITLTNQPIDN